MNFLDVTAKHNNSLWITKSKYCETHTILWLSACILWINTLFSRLWQRGVHFSKGKLHNSHFLMRAVKNNNQEWSIREMHSPGLWVLQVDCTVITSPEDPGEESFQKKGESWRGRRTSCSAGIGMHSSLLKQNMNANISSANRRRTLETLCTGSFIPSSLCCHEMKCFCSHTWNISMSNLVWKKEEYFTELPWGLWKDFCSHAISCCTAFILRPQWSQGAETNHL